MAHLQKHTKATCGHMFKHYERAKGADGEYIKFGNQNIDTARSRDNYNLAPDRFSFSLMSSSSSQGDFVRQRCGEIRMQNRKDVNVMCSWVLTAPSDLPDADHRQFFQTAYDFMAERYGGEKNVVSAYVHMDEATPHMHFAFVPVVEDKKRGGEKLSAKEAVDRKDLQSFHRDLSERMEQVFGRDVGILNEATKDGNKTVTELKQQTELQEQEKLEKETETLTAHLSELKEKAKSLADNVREILPKRQKAIEELNTALKRRGEVVGEVKSLSEQRNELKGEIKALTDDYNSNLLPAIRKIHADGEKAAGGASSWQQKIAEARRDNERNAELQKLREFVKEPTVAPAWQAFQNAKPTHRRGQER